VVLPTIGDVLSVELDGTPMPDMDWRLDNHRYLVRLDGESWPVCQDLAYLTDPSFAVVYVPGLAVPEGGRLAAGVLSCQMARRYCGAKCDLPTNTTSVSRQGVSITVDPQAGNTGLWLVDQWAEVVNRAVPTVRSPDVPLVRTHWPTGS
jgi:hypothetical protein